MVVVTDARTAAQLAGRAALTCPECGRAGVTLRRGHEDGYGCRYCEFWYFTGSEDRQDVSGRARLEARNPAWAAAERVLARPATVADLCGACWGTGYDPASHAARVPATCAACDGYGVPDREAAS